MELSTDKENTKRVYRPIYGLFNSYVCTLGQLKELVDAAVIEHGDVELAGWEYSIELEAVTYREKSHEEIEKEQEYQQRLLAKEREEWEEIAIKHGWKYE